MRYQVIYFMPETEETVFDFIFPEQIILELKNPDPSMEIISVIHTVLDNNASDYIEVEMLDVFKSLC